jgi:ADP-ribose pyrophosphatase YjhB (NUDIX family)
MKENKFFIKCRAMIFHQGKLLLVKHPHDISFAAFPGGHLEWGEDVKGCLSREIIEELGIKPQIGELLYINSYIQDSNQYIEFFFNVLNGDEYFEKKEVIRSHAHEIAEMIWVDKNDDIRILPKGIGEDFKNGTISFNTLKYIKDY